jgi:hypothetical protein
MDGLQGRETSLGAPVGLRGLLRVRVVHVHLEQRPSAVGQGAADVRTIVEECGPAPAQRRHRSTLGLPQTAPPAVSRHPEGREGARPLAPAAAVLGDAGADSRARVVPCEGLGRPVPCRPAAILRVGGQDVLPGSEVNAAIGVPRPPRQVGMGPSGYAAGTERERGLRRSCRGLRRFAHAFPHLRPVAALRPGRPSVSSVVGVIMNVRDRDVRVASWLAPLGWLAAAPARAGIASAARPGFRQTGPAYVRAGAPATSTDARAAVACTGGPGRGAFICEGRSEHQSEALPSAQGGSHSGARPRFD